VTQMVRPLDSFINALLSPLPNSRLFCVYVFDIFKKFVLVLLKLQLFLSYTIRVLYVIYDLSCILWLCAVIFSFFSGLAGFDLWLVVFFTVVFSSYLWSVGLVFCIEFRFCLLMMVIVEYPPRFLTEGHRSMTKSGLACV